mmetsp:Transcript_16309/g.55039  ORF Transcript_16309/g.55039 Transcript_16309/m.55039 type:complete len:300 (+) Transcript_16309:784-1683(+)
MYALQSSRGAKRPLPHAGRGGHGRGWARRAHPTARRSVAALVVGARRRPRARLQKAAGRRVRKASKSQDARAGGDHAPERRGARAVVTIAGSFEEARKVLHRAQGPAGGSPIGAAGALGGAFESEKRPRGFGGGGESEDGFEAKGSRGVTDAHYGEANLLFVSQVPIRPRAAECGKSRRLEARRRSTAKSAAAARRLSTARAGAEIRRRREDRTLAGQRRAERSTAEEGLRREIAFQQKKNRRRRRRGPVVDVAPQHHLRARQGARGGFEEGVRDGVRGDVFGGLAARGRGGGHFRCTG